MITHTAPPLRGTRSKVVWCASAPVLLVLATCGAGGSSPVQPTTGPVQAASPAPTAETVVLVGAGDIASCQYRGGEETARLVDAQPGTVFTSGDNVYESGTAEEFAQCYDPIWGRFKSRTRPSPGNHDYATGNAVAYFNYF